MFVDIPLAAFKPGTIYSFDPRISDPPSGGKIRTHAQKKLAVVCIPEIDLWNNMPFVSKENSSSKISLFVSIVTSSGRVAVKQH